MNAIGPALPPVTFSVQGVPPGPSTPVHPPLGSRQAVIDSKELWKRTHHPNGTDQRPELSQARSGAPDVGLTITFAVRHGGATS